MGSVLFFSSMQESILAQVQRVIKGEVSLAMKEQQAAVTSSIVQAMRSAAGTPIPSTHMDFQSQQTHILQLLQQGHLNQAFQQVFSFPGGHPLLVGGWEGKKGSLGWAHNLTTAYTGKRPVAVECLRDAVPLMQVEPEPCRFHDLVAVRFLHPCPWAVRTVSVLP